MSRQRSPVIQAIINWMEHRRSEFLHFFAEVSKKKGEWFRDLDSNQDTQLQRLMSYQLDDPGTD